MCNLGEEAVLTRLERATPIQLEDPESAIAGDVVLHSDDTSVRYSQLFPDIYNALITARGC